MSGSVLLNYSELQVLKLQDEEKAKNLLSYLVNMRLKMMEDLTAVDETKFTLDLSVKENLPYFKFVLLEAVKLNTKTQSLPSICILSFFLIPA